MVSPLRPPAGVYNRRHFLRITAAGVVTVAAGGVLAACDLGSSATGTPGESSTGAGSSPTGGAATPGAVGGTLSLFTWAGYDGKGVKTFDDWYASSGIELDVKYISNENLLNFMKSPGSEKWDGSSVNQGDAEYFYAQGVTSAITAAEVPAFNDMYDFFKDGPLFKVSDGVYNSVPWTLGPLGINTRPDKVPADALRSWEGLLDPKWQGRVGAHDSSLHTISTAPS